jgi:hypothetical protein
MQKHSNRIWIIGLILGWVFDLLFWKHAPGINFTIFVVFCLAGGFYVLRMEGIKPAVRSLVLVVPILFFAVITFVRQDILSLFLALAATLFLLILLVTTFVGGRWSSYGLADYVVAYLILAVGMVSKPFMLLTNERKKQMEIPDGNIRKKKIWPVVRGILIAIPIVMVFAVLLSSADLVFAQRLDEFVSIFRLEKLPEYIFRVIYILVAAYLLVGVFLHAATSSQNEQLISDKKSLVPTFLGFIESSIILGSVAILFIIFVVIQFQYFFGGQANIHIDGYTYAEYARKGFGELIMVALFSLMLFLGLSGITQRETPRQRNIFSGLGIAVVVLVGIILISAFQRLGLYESAYGFSQSRTYAHVFMIWLGLLLAGVVVLEIMHKERRFALAVMLAVIGFSASLALLNVDGFIIKQNVQRAVQGHELDVAYLANLTSDGIPTLKTIFNDPSFTEKIHEQVGAALVCLANRNIASNDTDWRAFNLSQYNGQQALNSVEKSLKTFIYFSDEYPTTVTTPSGAIIDCQGSGAMG